MHSSADRDRRAERRFWPFELLPRRPGLDGSPQGDRDASCRCEVEDDFQAAAAWLRQYEGNEGTYRTYRGAMDALFNWVFYHRQKAVSQLGIDDFAAFDRYMANPLLWECPAPRGLFRRGDPGWRPIASARPASSRRLILYAVKSFARWMERQGYASIRVEKVYSLRERRELGISKDGGTIRLTKPPIDINCWTVLKDSMDSWPATEPWARRRAVVGMLFYAGLNIEEARAVVNWPREDPPHIVVPGRTAHSREIVYLCTELLAWLSTWFDLGGLTVERVEGQGALGTRDRCCRDVRLALQAATTYARDQGLHEVASRMSRYGSHALFRALPRILEGRERIAWELTGATATNWNTTYSYIYRRGPLSAARYRELCANLSSELAMREGEARRRLFAT